MRRHDDSHTTCDEHFRIPAHPEMVAALGRAMWNFFSLEEGIVAILAKAQAADLNTARSLDPEGKEKRLRQLTNDLTRRKAPGELLDALKETVDDFRRLRKKYRNALAHAHAFTAGYDDDGTYLPGLSHTARDGSRQLLAHEAQELLAIAHEIEEGGRPIGRARRLLSALTTAER
jgi:hypothetical protein